jgi:hypothetical protein
MPEWVSLQALLGLFTRMSRSLSTRTHVAIAGAAVDQVIRKIRLLRVRLADSADAAHVVRGLV